MRRDNAESEIWCVNVYDEKSWLGTYNMYMLNGDTKKLSVQLEVGSKPRNPDRAPQAMLGVTGRDDSVKSPELFSGWKTRLLLTDNVKKMMSRGSSPMSTTSSVLVVPHHSA